MKDFEELFTKSIIDGLVKNIFIGTIYTDQFGNECNKDPQINYLLPKLAEAIAPIFQKEFFNQDRINEIKEQVIVNITKKFTGEKACQNYPYNIRNQLEKLYLDIGRMEIKLLKERKKEMQNNLSTSQEK